MDLSLENRDVDNVLSNVVGTPLPTLEVKGGLEPSLSLLAGM